MDLKELVNLKWWQLILVGIIAFLSRWTADVLNYLIKRKASETDDFKYLIDELKKELKEVKEDNAKMSVKILELQNLNLEDKKRIIGLEMKDKQNTILINELREEIEKMKKNNKI